MAPIFIGACVLLFSQSTWAAPSDPSQPVPTSEKKVVLSKFKPLEIPQDPSEIFDAEGCRKNNFFIMADGLHVDLYDKFCACPEQRANDMQRIHGGLRDLNPAQCNEDGTRKCTKFGHPMAKGPRRWCVDYMGRQVGEDTTKCNTTGYCQNACIRLGRMTLENDPNSLGFSNVGNCKCQEALQQETIPVRDLGTRAGYLPQCNADGSWKQRQVGYGGFWSVDANGNQIGRTAFS